VLQKFFFCNKKKKARRAKPNLLAEEEGESGLPWSGNSSCLGKGVGFDRGEGGSIMARREKKQIQLQQVAFGGHSFVF